MSAVEFDGGDRFGVDGGVKVRSSTTVQMGVDEARHHRHRTEIAVGGSRCGTIAHSPHDTVGNVNPGWSQQFSASQQGVGGD
jgi:hypothetical protein